MDTYDCKHVLTATGNVLTLSTVQEHKQTLHVGILQGMPDKKTAKAPSDPHATVSLHQAS